MSKRIDLFVIDGQFDFCDPNGALYVAGADQEAVRLANMIDRLTDPNHTFGHKLRRIKASLDSHHRNDCSHHTAWRTPDGSSPPPFTVVEESDIEQQKLLPRFPVAFYENQTMKSQEWALMYVRQLEAKGRSKLTLWPVHCQIGTVGQTIYAPLREAYDRWCATTNWYIDFITKGHWMFTEHYSALIADVPDSCRPETMMNTDVIADANQADIIVWSGWAGSHCLRFTALDALNQPGFEDLVKKSVFLEDASAAVGDIPGAPFKFSEWRKEFLDEVSRRGAQITTTDKFLV